MTILKPILAGWFILISFSGICQETMFSLFKKETKLADQYYASNNYSQALKLYLDEIKNNSSSSEIFLKIAKSHYYLKDYQKAAQAYEKYLKTYESLPTEDIYIFAEIYAALAEYDKAVELYQYYLEQDSENTWVAQKIWRLMNIHYMYEDSAHYAVREVGFNSDAGEMNAVPYLNGVVFLSNRKEITLINKVDSRLNTPFYKLYYSSRISDTSTDSIFYDLPDIFNKDLSGKYHSGPACFYSNFNKMIYTSSDERKTLQLYFAEKTKNGWTSIDEFPFNSSRYSIYNASISESGNVLYFTSDMNGGAGGKDIYRSFFTNGNWTKPENLGEPINTPFDEDFPYIHNENILYFSSNGHPGMGGLDIYKIDLHPESRKEIQNLGYPMNTNHDDFGIVIDSLATQGFFTSNRKNGSFDDDIYAFEMDIQTYPLAIDGKIRFIEHSWSDSSSLQVLSNAQLFLINVDEGKTVAETTSDNNGIFSIEVPYYGKYKVRVESELIGKGIVSFEVPKYRKLSGNYEIVVVKDAFSSEYEIDER